MSWRRMVRPLTVTTEGDLGGQLIVFDKNQRGPHVRPDTEPTMTFKQHFAEELDREAARTRRALEQVPLGRDDWKPHPKSMPLGRLAGLVASMPSWVSLIIDQDELNLTPPGGSGQYRQPSTDQLVQVHDEHVKKAKESLAKTTDDFLMSTNWKLLAGGQVVSDERRHIVLRDTMNHLAHHRGQLTVYLRMNDRTVPAIYGPSADDQRFL
jgi:uncharacterized damage-inducible protein DinB